MKKSMFAGLAAFTRFIFRRDRVRLLFWIAGISLFTIALVPVFDYMYSSSEELIIMAEMMENPAMVALVGPVYGSADYHMGAMFSNMMLVFMAVITGLMNIFLVARHTRQDEELGRLEVIRSLPTGSLTNLGAALLTALISNILIAVITGTGLAVFQVNGITFAGSMLFGICMGITGMLFAASTALFCQLTPNNRTALGLSLLFLMVLYLLRAAGDIGTETLSLISPLGLIVRSKIFIENIWSPVFIVTAETAVLSILAFYLTSVRDLNRGLLPEKPGRRHASKLLSTPLGLALRQLKTSILVWSAAIFLFAVMYGSVFGDLDSFIGNNAMLKQLFNTESGYSYAEQFIGLLMIIMSVLTTVPVLMFMHRVRSEEKQGFTEHLLGRSVSRSAQFGAHFCIAAVMSMFLQFLSAFGFWSAGSIVLETAPSLQTFLQSAFAYLPAIWVLLGLSAVLIGWLPERTVLSYAYLGLSFFVVYIGSIARLPEWTAKLSPFGYIPQLPMEEMKAGILILLTAIALVLSILGFSGYHRRDMKTG